MTTPKFKIYFQKKDIYYLLTFYLALLFLMFFFQRNLLYFPNEDTNINSNWIPVFINNKIVALEEKETIKRQNIVLVFHGNAGNANLKNYYNLIFPNSHVIVAEYPGYGFRKKEEINKENILKQADELTQELLKRKVPITIVGESLGSGVASYVAVKNNINQLVLATPYTSIASVAQDKFWFMPIYYLVQDNFDNVENLKKYHGKIAILIAEHDRVIPNKFAYQLYNEISDNNKIKILIKGSEHNSWVSSFSQENKEELSKFLNI